MMKAVTFASTNENKYREVQWVLSTHGIKVEFARVNPVEIQSDLLKEIVSEKAKNAFALVGSPVIVEDDGLFIDALNGFPGQYSSHAFKTIGNIGILKLLEGSEKRTASFHSLIAFYDGKQLSISEGRTEGMISDEIKPGGWGFDPIFVPNDAGITFAQLKEKKNEYSHRKNALDKFAAWYLRRS